MLKVPVALMLVVLATGLLPTNQTLGPVITISSDQPRLHHAEPHLSFDAGNPSELLLAAVAFPDSAPHRVDAFRSSDGGRTWTRERLPMPEGVAARSYIDPWTAIAPGGRAFVSVLGRADARSSKAVPWVFARSRDDVAWRHLVTVDSPERGSFDQQKIGVDRSSGDLVVSVHRWGRRTAEDNSTQTLALASIDPMRPDRVSIRHVAENNLQKMAMNVVTLADGSLFTGFFEWGRIGASGRLGLLWTLPVSEERGPTPPNLATSENGMGMGWLAADPRDGTETLYLLFARGSELVVNRSDSRGERWTAPVVIAGIPQGQFVISAIAVDGNGRVGVSWTAAKASPPGRQCYATRFSTSEDGGASFSAPVLLGDDAECLTVPGEPVFRAMSGELWKTHESYGRGGEYLGLVGFPDGGFFAAWTGAVDDVMHIQGRRVEF